MKATLAAVTCLAVMVAGCGGAESEPSLAEAAERTEALGSGRFEIEGFQGPAAERTRFDCTGAAEYGTKRVQVRCDYGRLGVLEAIGIGGDFYVRGDFTGFATGAKWVKESGDLNDTSLANLSPERLLATLSRASSETERVGEEDVRGASTVRYRLTVDCEGANLECDGTAPVDVWIDDDGVVRRIALDDDSGTATFEFFDFGVEVEIEPPPPDQVTEGGIDLVPGSGSGSGGGAGDTVTCADGEAVPISQARAVRTLRRHGFGMQDDPRSCIVSNESGPSSDVLTREGIVSCSINAKPPAGAPKTVVRRGADGADAELALENLTCTIFTDSTLGESKIDRLEAAFAELERAIRP